MARTVDEFGGLDILVNNAFRMDRGQPFESAALDYWRKVYEVNVWGALGLTQACVPHLRVAATERGDASIVFILSMSMRKIRPNEGAYSTSKAALRTAVQALALELGPAGVRVNGVAPGWIGGPNVDMFIQWESENRSVEPDGRPRGDRSAYPARCDPAAGRDRPLGRVLRIAVVEGRHRPDPRRERRRVVRLNARR